jgi:type II secretory pathway pseudopilin PulG
MHLHSRLRGDEGFGLIEVLVTALVVLILAAGTFATFDASGHATGLAKSRSTALTLAQQDQARLRAMPMSDLSNLHNGVTTRQACDDAGANCVTYTITSNADWVKDGQGVQSCTQADAGFDYLKITSTVSWPGIAGHAPAKEESLVTPPIGTFGPGEGALAVKVVRADGVTGIPGVPVQLSGTKNYNGVTNSQGCVVWGLLPSTGTYTVTASSAGFIDVNGNPTITQATSVTDQALTTVTVLYDQAASANVSFSSKVNTTGQTFAESVDRVTVAQPKLTAVRSFGTQGAKVASVSLPGLFPFGAGSPGGPYQMYAGDCPGQAPSAQTPPDTANLQFLPNLTAGGSATAQLQIPAFDFKVRMANAGSNNSYLGGSNGANMRDAVATDNVQVKVTPTTAGCAATTPTVEGIDTSGTNAARPKDPGFPYGTYTVCVQGTVGTKGTLHETFTGVALNKLPGVAVTSPTSGTVPTDDAPTQTGVVTLTAKDTSGGC